MIFTAVKRMLACALAVLLPAGCTPADTPGPTSGQSIRPREAPAIRQGEVRPLADFTVSLAGAGKLVEATSERTLTVGVRSWALLIFPVPKVGVQCVESAAIRIFKKQGGGTFEEMAVYPSLEFDAQNFKDGKPVGATTLLDNRPRGDFTKSPGERAGWVSFDISELYVTWVSGEPFPNTDLGVPEGQPLVLQLRPTTEPIKAATFLSSEAGRKTAPRLAWLARADCN